jgi:CBS domain-containing protein
MREGEPEPTHCNLTTSVFHGWQMVDLEILPTDQVRNYMTPNPVTVSPFTPMIELARTMVEGHIHRVIVVNEEMKPVGIVTSTDILAAVAHVNPNTLENLETQWPVAL